MRTRRFAPATRPLDAAVWAPAAGDDEASPAPATPAS